MRVFLSSTALDLVAHRRVADDTILRLSQQSVAMERFGPLPGEPNARSPAPSRYASASNTQASPKPRSGSPASADHRHRRVQAGLEMQRPTKSLSPTIKRVVRKPIDLKAWFAAMDRAPLSRQAAGAIARHVKARRRRSRPPR
jgi:hypothetical protein